MKRTSRELKALAREALLGQYGSLIGAMFLMAVFSMVLESLPFTMTGKNNTASAIAIQFISTLIINILTYLMQIGLVSMVLCLVRHRPYTLGNLFYAFRAHPDRFIIVSAIQIVITMLLQIPAYLVMMSSLSYFDRICLYLLLLMAGSVVSYIVLLGFALCEMLLIDNPDLGAIDSIRQSFALMHGNKGRYFYILISFFGLSCLTVLTLGIGMLWLYPYMTTTQVCFYLDITGELDQPHYSQTNDYGYNDRYQNTYDNTYGYGNGNGQDNTYGYGNGNSQDNTYGQDNDSSNDSSSYSYGDNDSSNL